MIGFFFIDNQSTYVYIFNLLRSGQKGGTQSCTQAPDTKLSNIAYSPRMKRVIVTFDVCWVLQSMTQNYIMVNVYMAIKIMIIATQQSKYCKILQYITHIHY